MNIITKGPNIDILEKLWTWIIRIFNVLKIFLIHTKTLKQMTIEDIKKLNIKLYLNSANVLIFKYKDSIFIAANENDIGKFGNKQLMLKIYGFNNKTLSDLTHSVSYKNFEDRACILTYSLTEEGFANVSYLNKKVYWVESELKIIEKEIKVWKENNKKFNGYSKRGYLLYGEPGTGKTEFIKYMAYKYNINIIQFDLNIPEIINSKVETARSIILVDDIDCFFDGRKTETKINFASFLSFVDRQEDCLIFFTCNNLSKLDPALIRPGRVDRQVQMPFKISNEGKMFLANELLKDYEDSIEQVINEGINDSAAGFKNRCLTELSRRLYSAV